jgi:hypothetical protein
MAASKIQMNWSAVGFTPSGGTLVPITKVQDVNFDPGGSLKPHSADGDKYPTTVVVDMNRPKCTVQTADVATAQALATGTIGTVTATFNDAKLAAGGAVVYSLINAVVANTPGGGKHGDYGAATITFESFSSDGITNPLSFTRT